MRPTSPKHRRAPGFTLIELMVVVILLGIMAATIIPEMRGTFEDAMLRSTSRELVGVFSLAASRAVSVNQLHRLRLDHRTGQYVLEKPAPEGGPRGGFVTASEVSGSEGKLDTRITIEIRNPTEDANQPQDEGAGPDAAAPRLSPVDAGPSDRDESISFYPDGTADAREILLRDRQGFRLLLRINPITSRVSVLDLKHE